ncbi:MAG: hypothetical protein OEY19_03475 [Gammaproteobacteria bacterium]|nr:hypothetical protein [Gammaproteobacteria bacterium]MDH5628954.1 hypothetical protein [Gammaproteobacteria bacterium]
MINNLLSLILRFDNLALKVRLLITFVMLLLVFATFDSLYMTNQSKQIRQLENSRLQNTNTINQLNLAHQQLNSNYLKQKNHPVQIQLDRVKTELDELKSDLRKKTINLIQPEMMASVIKSVFSHRSSLKLMSLTKLEPVILASGENNSQLKLYKHPVKLEFEGDYQSTVDFLLYLESMQHSFHFDSLEYLVDKYPSSIIMLELSTLSLNKEWIGG